MQKPNIIFKENCLKLSDFIRLKEQAFGSPCPENTARASLAGSLYVLHAEIGGEVIGMARIIGDGGFVNYIADVVVAPQHQGKGIGRMVMEKILAFAQKNLHPNGSSQVCLFAAKSMESFYEKFGFKSRPDEKFGAGMQLWLESGDT